MWLDKRKKSPKYLSRCEFFAPLLKKCADFVKKVPIFVGTCPEVQRKYSVGSKKIKKN
jgi:hypothetical protein